jgi:hypothetical protein
MSRHERHPRAVTRTTVRRSVALALATLALVLAAGSFWSFAAQAKASPASKALAYFHRCQTKAGGFTTQGAPQAQMTPWVIMAIKAAGQNPSGRLWRKHGHTPVQYLQSVDLERIAKADTSSAASVPGFYAKVIMAYKAAGWTDRLSRAGSRRIDLIASMLSYQDAGSGKFTTSPGGSGTYAAVNTTAFACLALKGAGRAKPALTSAAGWLKTQATSSGGFPWNPGGSADVDTTAAVVQALIRSGAVSRSDAVITGALSYARQQEQDNGGFTSGFGGTTNVESTALVVQAIAAAGQDPAAAAWRQGGRTPLDYIVSKQAANGSFYHFGITVSVPLLSTSQAVMGLVRRPLPVR